MSTPTVYVSTLPEDRILDYFTTMRHQDGVDRTALLRQLANVAVKRPADWSPAAVRYEHEHGERQRADRCFCCRTGDRRLYWHHVIAIQHGGSNDRFNLVAICLRCHAAVHPWMDGTPADKRRTSWSSPAQILVDISKQAETLPEMVAVASARDEQR